MENKLNFTEMKNPFAPDTNEYELDNLQGNSLTFEEGFNSPVRPSMNLFEIYEDKVKNDNALGKSILARNQYSKFYQNVDFEMNPFWSQAVDWLDLFNFFDLETPANKARTYDNELTFDIEFFLEEPWFSDDMKVLSTLSVNKTRKIAKKYNFSKFHLNKMKNSNDDSQSMLSSQKVEDYEKLSHLIQCLKKTKGVDKTQIDETLIARNIKYGQEKVAQQLRIPYRRYKSILNKWGIITTAGRKVKNLNLELQLVKWAMEHKSTGQMLTRKMIKDMAIEMSQEEGNSTTTNLSKGWLDKFVKRHEEIKIYLTSQKGRKGL
jgi:hypothetical protein